MLRSPCCLTRTDWGTELDKLSTLLDVVDLAGGDLGDTCLSGITKAPFTARHIALHQ